MRKKLLRGDQMTSVAEAQDWAKHLVTRESRGPGDTDNAMRRIEARYGIPYGVLWSLRYRAPKSICADVWKRMHQAYLHECDRQRRLATQEIEIAKILRPDAPALAQIEDALADMDG